MSKTKAGGSTRNGRDSESKRLGTKVYDGENISAGSIVVRQRGTKIHPGMVEIQSPNALVLKFMTVKIYPLARL